MRTFTAFVCFIAAAIVYPSCSFAQLFQRDVTSSYCISKGGQFTVTGQSGVDLGECFIPPQMPKGMKQGTRGAKNGNVRIDVLLGAISNAALNAESAFGRIENGSSKVRLSNEAQLCLDYLNRAKHTAESMMKQVPEPSDRIEFCQYTRETVMPFLATYYGGIKNGPECGPFYEYTKQLLQMIAPYIQKSKSLARGGC